MKNKSLIYTVAAGIVLPFLASCDNVSEEDRLIEKPLPPAKRITLIQEFTGVRCTNCPTAAEAVHDILTSRDGDVIAVCLHPEGTAYTMPYRGTDLTSHEATVYYDFYKPDAFPAAVIDGDEPSNAIQDWSAVVQNSLSQDSPIDLDLTCTYDKDTRNLKVDYKILFKWSHSGNLNVLVWVMENNIVGAQISGGKPVTDYVHNHVLRASLNGDWGEEIGNSFPLDTEIDGNAEIELKENWVAENCQVVAFVFEKGSNRTYVQQAALKDVISSEE